MSRVVKITAGKLSDVDVSAVSLVKHGAIRAPFKMLKSEEKQNMFTRLKNTLKAEPTATVMSGVLVTESFYDANKGSLTDMFPDGSVEKTEGGVVITPKDTPTTAKTADRLVGVTLNKDVAVLVGGVKKFDSFPFTTDFDVSVQGMSFFPSVNMALDSLRDILSTTMYQYENKEEVMSVLDEELPKFMDFIKNLVEELPEVLFKFEKSLGDEIMNAESKNPEDTVSKGDPSVDKETLNKGESDNGQDSPDTPKGESVSKGDEGVVEPDDDTVVDPTDKILASVTELANVVGQLTNTVKSQNEQLEAMSERVAKTEARLGSTFVRKDTSGLDSAISSLNKSLGVTSKSDGGEGNKSVFAGLMPQIEKHG